MLGIILALYSAPILFGVHKLAGGDWDYFFTNFEAARKVILQFHQFPWWNPWVDGGVPLYANPQFGLTHLAMPLVLLLGTSLGIKLSVYIYIIVGYLGMYLLLLRIKTKHTRAAALSLVWVLGSYITAHIFIGHFTFLSYLLVPILILLYLRAHENWLSCVWFGLFLAYFINAGPHYIAVQSLTILTCITLVSVAARRLGVWELNRLCVAFVIGLTLSLPKLILVNNYLKGFLTEQLTNPVTPITITIRAFAQPMQDILSSSKLGVGWWEISSYLGIGMVVAGAIAAFLSFHQVYREKKLNLEFVLLSVTVIFILIGLGPFSRISPYSLLQHLPLYKVMQVPTRWFGWAVFSLVLLVAKTRKWPKLINYLVLASIIELLIWHIPYISPFNIDVNTARYPAATAIFEEYEGFPEYTPHTSSMFIAAQRNYGEVRGYEPIIGRDVYSRETRICGINNGCTLVSKNARISYWSPNKVVIERLAVGDITLNVNPGSYWLVNGERQSKGFRPVEPNTIFKLQGDGVREYILTISPL